MIKIQLTRFEVEVEVVCVTVMTVHVLVLESAIIHIKYC